MEVVSSQNYLSVCSSAACSGSEGVDGASGSAGGR